MAAVPQASPMTISVLSPEREMYKGAITSVTVPGVDGEFQVLRNHAPIVSALMPGAVVIRRADNQIITMKIQRGFVEVLNNEVALLIQGVTQVSGL